MQAGAFQPDESDLESACFLYIHVAASGSKTVT
jgi:hypothetical protein